METSPAVLNLLECEEAARSLLPQMYYDYISGGAGDHVALRGNRAAYEKWRIVYRVLRGIASVDLTTRVVNHDLSMPVLMSPVAFQRLASDEGEVASAAAAKSAGTIFTLSTLSTRTIEDVGEAAGMWWFQLYYYAEREISSDLIQRAKAAGASAILVTVDTPLLGRREADERNNFALPRGVELVNLLESARRTVASSESGSQLASYVGGMWHPSLSWSDIEWVASQTKLPVGIKGVVAPEDARLAIDHGVKIVVVSNHGGRQLDHAIASLDALPDIAEAAEGKLEILLDGGVRRGTDVIKALALGAKAVMIGRPYVYGLAMDGQAGVERVLEMLKVELRLDMLLSGCEKVSDIRRELVVAA